MVGGLGRMRRRCGANNAHAPAIVLAGSINDALDWRLHCLEAQDAPACALLTSARSTRVASVGQPTMGRLVGSARRMTRGAGEPEASSQPLAKRTILIDQQEAAPLCAYTTQASRV